MHITHLFPCHVIAIQGQMPPQGPLLGVVLFFFAYLELYLDVLTQKVLPVNLRRLRRYEHS